MNRQEIDRAWARLGVAEAPVRPDDVISGEPGSPAERVLRGIARFEAGDARGAAEDFDAVLAVQPENAVAALHSALAVFRLGDRARAGKILDAAVLFPEHAFVARFLEVFWPLRFEHAALRPTPGPAEAPADLPHADQYAAWRGGNGWSKARTDALAGRMRDALRKACEKDDYERAWHLASRIRELLPDDEMAAAELALMGINTGRYAEGRCALESHLDGRLATGRDGAGFETPAPAVLAVWALVLHETGEHRGALAVASRVRPEGPDDYCIHLVAAVSWLMLGDRAAFRRVLGEGQRAYFLDTWELILRPFVDRVRAWLREGS